MSKTTSITKGENSTMTITKEQLLARAKERARRRNWSVFDLVPGKEAILVFRRFEEVDSRKVGKKVTFAICDNRETPEVTTVAIPVTGHLRWLMTQDAIQPGDVVFVLYEGKAPLDENGRECHKFQISKIADELEYYGNTIEQL